MTREEVALMECQECGQLVEMTTAHDYLDCCLHLVEMGSKVRREHVEAMARHIRWERMMKEARGAAG